MAVRKRSPIRKLFKFLASALLLFALLLLLGELRYRYLTWQRPLFHNNYGKNDRMLFNIWFPPAAVECDEFGPCIVADYKLNLFVILMPPDVHNFLRRGFGDKHSVAYLFKKGNDAIRVFRDESAIVAYWPDGSTGRVPIDDGLAEKWYAMYWNSDASVLTPIDNYLKAHPNPEIESLLKEVRQQQARFVQ